MFDRNFPRTELWRLSIDGYKQHLGPMVFDNPRGTKGNPDYHAGEAGYLKAMCEGLEFAAISLNKELNIELIEKFHGIATHDVEDGELSRDDELAAEDNRILKTNERGKIGHGNTTSISLNPQNDNNPNAENVTLQGYLQLVQWLKGHPQLQNYFSITTISQTPRPEDFKLNINDSAENINRFYQNGNIAWICNRIPNDVLAEAIEFKLTTFNERVNALNEAGKLILIVELVHDLEIIHPFQDGNCRTFVLLLNHLLIKNNLSPAILLNPNRFDGMSIDELVHDVQQGQIEYNKYIVTNAIELIQAIDPYNFNAAEFKTQLSDTLSPELHIRVSQLNSLYESIIEKNIALPKKDYHISSIAFKTPGKNAIKEPLLAEIKNLFNEVNLDNIAPAVKTHIQEYAIHRAIHGNTLERTTAPEFHIGSPSCTLL
jgi:hypothetical protein